VTCKFEQMIELISVWFRFFGHILFLMRKKTFFRCFAESILTMETYDAVVEYNEVE